MKTYTRLGLLTAIGVLLFTACARAPITTESTPAGATSPSARQPQATPRPAVTPLTPVESLGRTGTPIDVDIEGYRLVLNGLVERPLAISYDELLSYPAVSQVPQLECPGFFVDYAEWRGPLVRTLLEEAGVQAGAQEVQFCDGGALPYCRTLTLEEALLDDTYLAHTVNGQILPPEHGYPIRLVVGSKLGSYWVKWLFQIEVK